MKNILLGLFIIISIAQVSAQKYGGGLEGGLVYSWLSTDSKKASTDGGRFSFVYGMFMDKNVAENFSFSTGINILETGGTIKYNESIKLNTIDGLYTLSEGSKVFYKLRYLELPVSIKGKTKEIGYITYFAKVGASPMFAIKSRANVDGTVIDENAKAIEDKNDMNIKDDINWFNIGFHVGGGMEYSLGGTTSVIAEIQYTNNFLDITKDNEDYNNKVSVTDGMVVLKVGIKF